MTPIWNNFKMFLWLTFIGGCIYPLLITLIAQLAFAENANGSQIKKEGKLIGSALIGQKFDQPKYFWGRPSAVDYNPLPSGGSNLGPTSKQLKKNVEERRERLAAAHGSSPKEVPAELLFASGSGLDPHISPAAAYWQIDRIVKARNLDPKAGHAQIQKLIDTMMTPRVLGFIGMPYVNVLLLNIALDENVKTAAPPLPS